MPPYFCTIHVADGSMEFWCIFGGVAGEGVSSGDEPPEGGELEALDIARNVDERVTR